MARILAVTDGPIGMRYATVELGRRLAAAGHDVTFAGEAGARDLVRHHGLRFSPIEANGIQRFRDSDRQRGALDRWRHRKERRRAARTATGVDGFRALLEERDPELVLLDGEMQEHVVTTLGTGTPLALLNTFAAVWRLPGTPPPHTPIRPGDGWRGSRAGIALAWWAYRGHQGFRRLAKRLRQAGCDRITVLRELAREQGVDLRREADSSQWLNPFTWPRLPALSLHAREFEFEPDAWLGRPPGVHFVGPMLLDDRREAPLPNTDRDRLDAVYARHGTRDDSRRGALIFAGFGSYFTAHARWLQELLAAVAARPDWTLVLSLGGRQKPADLGELPANVQAFSWVPQREVLERADLAVVHGGINTVDECVMARVPMLVCCGHRTDMAGNMARIVHHGIGRAADPARDTAQTIDAHLVGLLDDPDGRARLAALSSACARYAADQVLERLVARLLAGDPEVLP